MNRYEATRIAKEIFMAHGTDAGQNYTNWSRIKKQYALNDENSELVKDYYYRTVNRVSDWLRL